MLIGNTSDQRVEALPRKMGKGEGRRAKQTQASTRSRKDCNQELVLRRSNKTGKAPARAAQRDDRFWKPTADLKLSEKNQKPAGSWI